MDSSFGNTETADRRRDLYAKWGLLLALWLMQACSAPQPEARGPHGTSSSRRIEAAVRWMISQRSSDGLWHSDHYGNLKGGATITAFCLYALSHVDAEWTQPHREALQASCDALLPVIRQKGFVANPDSIEYPVYASAALLVAVHRLQLQMPDEVRGQLVDYLLAAQVDQGEGYELSDPDFGGWDMEGMAQVRRKSTGTNISVGAFAAEALALEPKARVETALANYRIWLSRAQNVPGDGGFFFHADRAHDGNKAGWEDGREDSSGHAAQQQPRSYGTATADGIRGLLACQSDPHLDELIAAVDWFEPRLGGNRVPGFEDSPDPSWSEALVYYYWFSLSKSLECFATKTQDQICAHIVERLVESQQPQGYWQNPNARMREDDPLIATGLALVAWSLAQSRERE
jgi:hypothetical protein